MNIPVIYEDSWLLVLDKPPGLLVVPSPKNEKRTLSSIINEYFKNKGASYNLYPCHRLDRETSGLIIYAKGKSAQKKMMQLFKERKVAKTYIGFVQGNLALKKGRINQRIKGMTAITDYELIERRAKFDIVKITPLTGRTNQIRIHFKKINHPLVGETKFAFRKDYSLKAKRLCLHAQALNFVHPIGKKQINLVSDLEQDLEKFIEFHHN